MSGSDVSKVSYPILGFKQYSFFTLQKTGIGEDSGECLRSPDEQEWSNVNHLTGFPATYKGQ